MNEKEMRNKTHKDRWFNGALFIFTSCFCTKHFPLPPSVPNLSCMDVEFFAENGRLSANRLTEEDLKKKKKSWQLMFFFIISKTTNTEMTLVVVNISFYHVKVLNSHFFKLGIWIVKWWKQPSWAQWINNGQEQEEELECVQLWIGENCV